MCSSPLSHSLNVWQYMHFITYPVEKCLKCRKVIFENVLIFTSFWEDKATNGHKLSKQFVHHDLDNSTTACFTATSQISFLCWGALSVNPRLGCDVMTIPADQLLGYARQACSVHLSLSLLLELSSSVVSICFELWGRM